MSYLSVLFHTHLAIAILVMVFDGVERVLLNGKDNRVIRWEDLR
jgi:hypothetical protein